MRDVYTYTSVMSALTEKGRVNTSYAVNVLNYLKQAKKQSKAKMCNGRRHVPLCPASANEKYIVQKCNYNTRLLSVFIWLLFPTPVNSTL